MTDLDLDLYRACKKNRRSSDDLLQAFEETQGVSLLYPDYEGFTRKDGSRRGPDVSRIKDPAGDNWVCGINDMNKTPGRPVISSNEGVSISKDAGKFGYAMWYYFLLPKGTTIPECFDISQTGHDASHYSIRLKNRMRQDAYEGALDNLARASLAKAVELKRKSLSFE